MSTNAEQLRYEFRSAPLAAWLSGKCPETLPRWEGDDGKRLRLEEWQWWPEAARDAEQVEFERLDALYEAAKAAQG